MGWKQTEHCRSVRQEHQNMHISLRSIYKSLSSRRCLPERAPQEIEHVLFKVDCAGDKENASKVADGQHLQKKERKKRQ